MAKDARVAVVVGAWLAGVLCGAAGSWLWTRSSESGGAAPSEVARESDASAPPTHGAPASSTGPTLTPRPQPHADGGRSRASADSQGSPFVRGFVRSREAGVPETISPLEPVPGFPADPDNLARVAQDARSEPEKRAWALTALSRMDPPEAVRIVTRFLAGTDATERRIADDVLKEARDAGFAPLLRDRVSRAGPEDDVKPFLRSLARMKDRDWSPMQATGAPDTPVAGDHPTAWASKRPEMGPVWLILEYERAVPVEEIRIHETLSPGSVSRIDVQGSDGRWETVWEGTAPAREAPFVFAPPLRAGRLEARAVRLTLETDRVPGWNEIDAVGLVGGGMTQWAAAARASSSYSD